MYLKEIKAFGFKSFADKIKIELGKNINGIVGPNGSGKSNVVDAVRWVLGEQSVKSLRGDGNMSDVIFSGSKSRKPLNSASVTLVFDNSDHHFNLSFDEVSIKRVIYKTGENEYYLNNEKVRLKDIQDLLTDSGTSKESFNIISQGKIDEILLQKPLERRVMFEEASGVLKYKKRKEEAIKKLDRTNANLDRVNDIIHELSLSIAPIQEQANKAKRYLKLKEELSDIEISLITNDIYESNTRNEELKIQKEKLNDEILKQRNENITSDVEITKQKEKLKQTDEKLFQKQSELLKLTQEEEQVNTDIILLKERRKYELSEDKKQDSFIQLNDKKLELEKNIHLLDNDIGVKQKERSVLEKVIEDLQKKYQESKNKAEELTSKIASSNRLLTDYKYKINYLDDLIANNNNLPHAVKKILNNKILPGIYSTIGKVLKTEDKYLTLLDVALGSACNYIIVEDNTSTKRAIQYLKENNLGRATFYPLDTIKARYIDQDILLQIKSHPGFLGVVSDLVHYDLKYKNIILNQLGSVLAVDNLDNAREISKIIHQKYRVVTLDGQLFNVGGSVTGGSVQSKNTNLKDKYELENLIHQYKMEKETRQKNEESLHILEKEINELDNKMYQNRSSFTIIQEVISNKENILKSFQNKLKSLEEEIHSFHSDESSESKLYEKYHDISKQKSDCLKKIEILKLEKENLNDFIVQVEEENKKSSSYVNKLEKELNAILMESSKIESKLDTLLENLNEEYNMTFENAKEKYHLEIEKEEARSKVSSLKNEMKYLGEVNVASIGEYERLNERYTFLTSQKEDLQKAEQTLLEIITEMDQVMEDKFLKTFYEIKEEFQKVFHNLFKGGTADLILTDPDNLLETGIEITASPPGKSLKHLSLLSGGEKTFTAISLLFAFLNIRPVPFAILDEVEAALDEANVISFGEYLKQYQNTQFIIITHKKKTMEFADILYGITMQESGVSKLVSVKLSELDNTEKD